VRNAGYRAKQSLGQEELGHEIVKPVKGIQLVKIQPGQSRSGQAGSESCHSSGDGWVRSVDRKEVGREGTAPKSFIVAEADDVSPAEGSIGTAAMRGCYEPPESEARGTLSEGFPRNLGDLDICSSSRGATGHRGRPERPRKGVEES
jgi:hypothetical protein